jgi:YVTN family beta-propeller protein/probable HAF family extracellular repeat protein
VRRISFEWQWLGIVCSLVLIAPIARAQNFGTVSYPGAALTGLYGINNQGVAVGYYSSGNSTSNRAILLSLGKFTDISVPSSTESVAFGINDSGDVVGFYLDPVSEEFKGFLLSGGNYTTIDPPGSVGTQARGINDAGQIVGFYRTSDGNSHGFGFFKGVYTTIDCPCGQTAIQNISNSGIIVGYYTDSSNVTHGLEYSSGVFTTLDFPGANNFTVLTDIDDSGTIVGTYSNATNEQTGFKFANGQFSTLNAPPPYQGIDYAAINNSGQIVAEAENFSSGFSTSGLFLSTGPYAYIPISNGNVVSVYDTAFDLPTATIPVGAAPFDAAISPNGLSVYVDNSNSNSISVIDPSTNTVTATIPVGPMGSIPAGVVVTPDSSKVYVASHGTNVVSVISAATNSVIATVPVGSYPFLLAITPNGQYVYVPNFQSNNVSVISTATNRVVATIPVGLAPQSVAITPDGKSAYVTCTSSNLVYVIDTASNTVVQTIPVSNGPLAATISPSGATTYVSEYFGAATAVLNNESNGVITSISVEANPYGSAITPDGAFLWQTNSSVSTLSVISTATNSVATTIPLPGSNFNVAIGSAPPTSQTITKPLSPIAPNVFNFGPHNFTVQYPPGTNFSGVNMTVTATQTTQQTFKGRVAGTQFANATCIVYSGEGGNCEDYRVTCSSTSGGTISCPSESTPSITLKTSFDTQQQIINPGFLTTPIGTNEWTNIFEAFYLQQVDPTMVGRTKGFSEFFAVDLGVSNDQGGGTFTNLDPLKPADTHIFPMGTVIPVQFTLSSLANPTTPVTDATAGLSVVQVSNASGNATANIILNSPKAFTYSGGKYIYSLNTKGYAPGTYDLTIYGNAFVAQQVRFTIPVSTTGAVLVTTLQSLTLNAGSSQYQAVFNIKNTGSAPANGIIVSASALNNAGTLTTLPVSLGNLAHGSSVTATLLYPLSAGAQGSAGRITISESYAGGSSGAGVRVQLP